MIGDPFTIRCIVICVILFVIFGLAAYAFMDDEEQKQYDTAQRIRMKELEERRKTNEHNSEDRTGP